MFTTIFNKCNHDFRQNFESHQSNSEQIQLMDNTLRIGPQILLFSANTINGHAPCARCFVELSLMGENFGA